MNTINFIFGCHSHQPVGNFDNVFEMAYEQAYKPFMDVFDRYPAVKVTQHFTGPLLDWFQAHAPEFIQRLRQGAESGRVEIMGGAYYEPLLSAIPDRDAIAQIGMMARFCEREFGQVPKGMWLTERVWEPHMPLTLGRAGIEYTALDDTHFLIGGLKEQDLFGYYVTEDQGVPLKVFPILNRLRYTVPFHPVHETIEYLREHATEDGLACAVLHDDGEKFGIWPETFHSVYEEGWLEEFFQALTDNADWIKCVTYQEYMEKASALGRVYLPTASYHEMMEWALPPQMQHQLKFLKHRVSQDGEIAPLQDLFIRGSFWRNFLAKYAESNNIQKKMLRVSEKLDRLRGKNDPRVREAERLLFEGQCNCAYWHGVFGGLYLNHLRTALYEKLIAADKVMDDIAHGKDGWVNTVQVDFDADGNDEAILENAHQSLYFHVVDGGTLFEWDYKDKPFNFINTLTRREEAYHDELRHGHVQVGGADGGQSIHEMVRAKEEGLENFLIYDPYRRVSLRDHFLPLDTSTQELWCAAQRELGDFHTGRYHCTTKKRSVTLAREGVIHQDGHVLPATVSKTVTVQPRASFFEIRYDVAFHGSELVKCLFGVEFAVNLLSGTSFDRYYRSDDADLNYTRLGEMGCDENLSHIALRDDWQRLECGFRFGEPADRIYRFGLETVSQSEGGQERVYQGSVLVFCWKVELAPDQSFSQTIMAEIVPVEASAE